VNGRERKRAKKPKKTMAVNFAVYLVLALLAAAALFPVLFIAANSFMSEAEIMESYASDKIYLHLIPGDFTLEGYRNVFFASPAYLMKFWNSMFISAAIVAGQVFVACLGGYGFAKFVFPLKNAVFYFLIILMMMPLQVTLVPNYIVLDRLGLIGSYAALILPGIFSTFGVFLLAQIFSSIPDSIIEAAKIDGANHMKILLKIVIPHNKAGIAALVILNFIDNWNMVEQPLVFLKDSNKHPLSIFLANINHAQPGVAFVCGILAIIPVFFLFLHLKDSLVYGIENANLK